MSREYADREKNQEKGINKKKYERPKKFSLIPVQYKFTKIKPQTSNLKPKTTPEKT